MNPTILSLLLLPALAASAQQAPATEPLNIGSRLELFVDGYVIDAMRGVSLKLHSPQPASTAISFDQPWEGNVSAYVTVIKDADRYRMYYRGSADPRYIRRSALKPGEPEIRPHPEFTCYAESRDGIHWSKPALELFEFNRSKQNNILWVGPEAHNFAPFIDGNPAADLSARYKALGRRQKGLIAFKSSDGLHWARIQEAPVITDGAFDSLNVAFWDPIRKHYVAIYRDFRQGLRTIKFASSKDFLHWTPGQWADFGDAPPEHLYTNATTAYFRAPHIYLAFPKRFLPERTQFADAPDPGISEAVFMSSRDGVNWDRRFMEAFIRPGRDERNWVHRSNMLAPNVVATAADEISLYISRHYTFPSAHIERMVLRTDGFVSVHADFGGGEFVTKPLLVEGSKLALNYATSAAGSVRLEIQNAAGKPLPGLALDNSPVLWGDKTEEVLALPIPAGSPIRLRFVMKDADLYSIQFRQ